MNRSVRRSGAALATRLRSRRSEIEQVALSRVLGIAQSAEALDAEYQDGLKTAVSVAVDLSLRVIEGDEGAQPFVPDPLLIQARLAARNSVGLDTVLRRYSTVYSLLSDLVIQEAEDFDLLPRRELQRVLRTLAGLFDRLVAAVSGEYAREESSRRVLRPEEVQAERVRRLLAGDYLDTAKLDYIFDAFHTGLIAVGAEQAIEAIRRLGRVADHRLLLVRHDENVIWAWLGTSRRRLDGTQLRRLANEAWPAHIPAAMGNIAHGLPGWRQSHHQAQAGLSIALRRAEGLIHYSDVALLSTILRDDLLVASLSDTYLEPLSKGRDGGAALRKTLRAYFGADRNITSAAATLEVSRQTVINRIHVVERQIGRSLSTCVVELEAALRIEEMQGFKAAG